jgi:DNA-binding transcriptional MocR family regulator
VPITAGYSLQERFFVKIILDRQSPQPIYRQIRDRIGHLIRSGALQAGQRLPSIRVLAAQTQVNKLTVIEAYSLLEADGLIYARPGSGYFVTDRAIAPTHKSRSGFSPIQTVIIPEQGTLSFFELYRNSMQARHRGDIIDFSAGFTLRSDLDDLQRIARRAMLDMANHLFDYDFAEGQLDLRTQISQLLIQQGFEISPECLIITNGAMQGLSLTIHTHVQPRDWVIVESPTYHGALAILQEAKARIIGIPMTSGGMNLDLLAQYLDSHRPKLIYTISTLHSPTGITTSYAHRQQMIALAEQYDCLILEDNAYEGLSFGTVPPPIKAFDQSGRVIYANTFSKTLMPGLRVGYLVATGQNYTPLLERKLLQDLSASRVSQAIVAEYLASGHYRRHLNRVRAHNLHSRDVMLQALAAYFPEETSWTEPEGGILLWVKLPETVCVEDLCHKALAHRVLIASGATFFPDQQGYPAMRLSFSHPPDVIEKGISILGMLIRELIVEGIKQKVSQ